MKTASAPVGDHQMSTPSILAGMNLFVTPAKRPSGRAEPGPDGPAPSWKSFGKRRFRPRIVPSGRPG
jgi:hypothetical protein